MIGTLFLLSTAVKVVSAVRKGQTMADSGRDDLSSVFRTPWGAYTAEEIKEINALPRETKDLMVRAALREQGLKSGEK